jgi:hypothetical protein
MFAQSVQELIATVSDGSSTEADIRTATQSFFTALNGTSVGEANSAISAFAGFFSLDDFSRAGHLALICGALVERGCDPMAIAQPLSARLKSLLEAATVLAEACRARMPAMEKDQDPHEAFEEVRRQVASAMPLEAMAWEALKQFWRPAIAVYSVSSQARAAARGLRDMAVRISDDHEAGHWLRLILSVLDDEPILAIEPQTGLGILGRISGVVDNFQLNVLLMDAFPQSAKLAPRVSRQVADVACGIGPQQTEDHLTGAWNLYTWRAVRPGLILPNPKDHGASSLWIWNEGVPEDIPLFEGRRVLLLGPPSYPRGWQCQRMFGKLPAGLECECRLSTSEVADWLQRMLSANVPR